MQIRKRLDEGFLSKVPRLFGISDHFAAEVIDSILVLAQQLPVGDLITLFATLDEEEVFFFHPEIPCLDRG